MIEVSSGKLYDFDNLRHNQTTWGGKTMLRRVIAVTDDETSVKNAIKEVLRSKHKGYEVALYLKIIKNKDRKKEIMKLLTKY